MIPIYKATCIRQGPSLCMPGRHFVTLVNNGVPFALTIPATIEDVEQFENGSVYEITIKKLSEVPQ